MDLREWPVLPARLGQLGLREFKALPEQPDPPARPGPRGLPESVWSIKAPIMREQPMLPTMR